MCKLFHPFSDGCNYIKKKKKKTSDRHIYTLAFILATHSSSTSQHPFIFICFFNYEYSVSSHVN